MQPLVSDVSGRAPNLDPNLVNAWGLAFNPFGYAWVADNGMGFATLYDGDGHPQPLVVTIPGGSPTGVVFNGSEQFVVSANALSGPAHFLFATENGTIAGWSPTVDAANAVQVVDSAAAGAVYKGLAMGANGTEVLLYATDFHNGRVDVFNGSFQPVALAGTFSDPTIPGGFAPFGIQNILGNLYVTYARQDAARHDDVAGPGLGFVNVFDTNGRLVRRFARRGQLNSPWGLALAPADFGRFSNCLLVGNFGDGTINAFDPVTRTFRGKLRTGMGKALKIDGLWGLAFGNGLEGQPVNTLYFTAGPSHEAHGLYGRIVK
ncbi:MAG TPA: TIGR03118 family protein [bacterium]